MSDDTSRTLEARLRATVESSPSGLLMVDGEGCIVLVNAEIERLFGYAREELLGKSVETLVPERFRSRHPEDRVRFFAAPRSRAMGAGRDLFGLRKDGSEIPVEIGLNPIDTDEGLFVVASVVNISARKAGEEERRRLEAQLRQAQKMEAVGTLAGGIAHDFNNILGAIVGYVELLREEVTSLQGRADLEQVFSSAQRGKELVERILTFSRRERVGREPLALGEAVREATKLLRATLPATIEIEMNVHPDTFRVLSNATAVHQIVMNLSTNAAHAMPSGGRLEIAVEPRYLRDSESRAHPDLHEGPYVILTVSDTGHGMEPHIREHVFEPFFTTKPPGAGTGLGLSMIHGIMKEHGGAVRLSSAPGEGTIIRCFFPAIASADDESAASESSLPRGTGQHVLLVDDEEALVRLGMRRLQAIGYSVTGFTSNAEALGLFRAEPAAFDLVITDYSMPRMSGLEFARAITRVRATVPVVLLTGFIEDLPREVLAEAGVSRLLRKPVTLDQLARTVHDTLGAHARVEGTMRHGIEG